ncbi:hypothetical protein LO772_32460 [Yinghuangia sp. ASG 101]|uniref:hypothetical protein n=1 Tax=Yinghuangia sp. ASG 101 TaxID=2896848 RepID=UPI001E29DBED|nr:hypothetical protein [Yinghuangia sp. ASG 101]UGQ11451.1 hypothetical protein LO772_32460 [Yinghuangia sp. ASG 101]
MSGDPDAYEVDVPLLLGTGTSNATWTIPGTGEVQRWATGPINALDLRVINDTDARAALRDADPGAYTSAPTPAGEPLAPLAGLPRLEPHETDPASSEAAFDWHVGYLIDELAYVSHHSEAAAHSLMPKARRSLRILTSLPEAEVPLRCAPDASDSALVRSFTVRVAEVVTPVIGEALARRFRLPTPQQLHRGLPPAREDRSDLVVAHGDPTVGNFMWSFGEAVLTDWELARPTGKVSAAAHTLAALVTRAPYPLRSERIEQFVDGNAGARRAVNSGLYGDYHAWEVARAPYVDVLRGLRGDVDPALVHRNVARFLGDNAPSPRQVKALLRAHADDDFPIPALPPAAAEHLAERPPGLVHPDEQYLGVSVLRDEVVNAAEAAIPPDLYRQHHDFLAMVAETLPAARGSVIKVGERLREADMTEVSAQVHPDRMTYRFTKPQHPGQTGQHPGARQPPAHALRKNLAKGD